MQTNGENETLDRCFTIPPIQATSVMEKWKSTASQYRRMLPTGLTHLRTHAHTDGHSQNIMPLAPIYFMGEGIMKVCKPIKMLEKTLTAFDYCWLQNTHLPGWKRPSRRSRCSTRRRSRNRSKLRCRTPRAGRWRSAPGCTWKRAPVAAAWMPVERRTRRRTRHLTAHRSRVTLLPWWAWIPGTDRAAAAEVLGYTGADLQAGAVLVRLRAFPRTACSRPPSLRVTNRRRSLWLQYQCRLRSG